MNHFEDVKEGDQILIVTYRNFGRGTIYQGPFPVTKVTKTQFTVNGQRFTKSWGKPHGYQYSNSTARYATEEALAEKAEAEAKHAKEQRAKERDANAKERALREKYGASHIDDEEVQKILGKVRFIAEIGAGVLEEFKTLTRNFDSAKPWRVVREISDDRLTDKLQWAVIFQDCASDLHESLVKLYDARQRGAGLTFSGVPHASEITEVLKAQINVARRREETEFFGHRYDDDNAEAWARYIKRLRDIDGVDCDYPVVTIAKEDKDEA